MDTIAESTQRQKFSGLSTETKPKSGVSAKATFKETDTGDEYEYSGTAWYKISTSGASNVADGFKPSSYDADLTMDGTAQAVAIATGAGRVRVYNQGATTESIRFAFGTSEANAQANLTIVTAAATTGILIPAQADNSAQSIQVFGVPKEATHYAVANAVAADVQAVNIIQGV